MGSDNFSVRWTGQLLPPTSGAYELTVGANDGFRLYIDGKVVIDGWEPNARMQSKSTTVQPRSRQAHDIKLEYFEDIRDAEVRLAWRLPGAKPPFEEALDIAKAAEVIVFVGGLTGDVEGEEMNVSFPGFAGGDRTDLQLPATQQKLLEALQATGKPVVLVLTDGLGDGGRLGAGKAAGDPGGVLARALEIEKTEGQRIATWSRAAALAVVGVLLIYLNPRWEMIYYQALLLLFVIIGIAHQGGAGRAIHL